MRDQDETKEQLLAENTELRQRVAALEGVDSERKRAEEALRESERRFREMMENVHLLAVMLDREGRITFCNEFLLQLTGWQREEVTGINWFDTFVPADQAVKDLFLKSIAGETIPPHHENDIATRIGERRRIAWSNTVLRDSQGKIIGTASIGEDITERKRAEDALRISEEKHRGVVDACPDAVVMSDLNGRVLFASRQAWGLLGLSDSDELLGRSVFDWVIEDDRKRLAGNMSNLVEVGVRRNTEYTSIRQDGTTVPVDVSSVVIRDATGQQKAVMAVIRDITDRKRAEDALERERQSLWRMLQASDHERQIISYEIHDGLAQYLAAAAMQFQSSRYPERELPERSRKSLRDCRGACSAGPR